MSIQVFLQGKLLGIEQFVLAPAEVAGQGESLLAGRAHWVTLLTEVLPRALLAELGLAKVLLGTSGGGQFLVVLTTESLGKANAFLESAAASVARLSGRRLRLIWAWTENLGDWTLVRRRLAEEMWRCQHTSSAVSFDPFLPDAETMETDYFLQLGAGTRTAATAGWSPGEPGRVLLESGLHSWTLGSSGEIAVARNTALDEDGAATADLATLAGRAQGRPAWGVLRGDVDGFAQRLRRVTTIEEHIQLSMMFKQFFASEMEVACLAVVDAWRKVSVLYSGGDDFAVYGSWDSLLTLAREIHRIFHVFADANLKDLPGPEGKTITMALQVAPEIDTPFAFVYEEAGRNLEAAKCTAKDCIHLFGKIVEWRQFNHSNDLKDMMLRMVRELRCPPEFLEELGAFYREKPSAGRPDRPWRYHRRLGVALGEFKDREVNRLRTALISDMVGRGLAQVKLRPAGLVAVTWARMILESSHG